MRKLFYGLAIFFGLIIAGFFILDNFVLYGFFTAIGPALLNPGDVTALEIVVEKVWGKQHSIWSITGPRNPETEQNIVYSQEQKHPSECESHKNFEFEYNRCYYELALLLTNKSLCKDVESALAIFDPQTCKATIDGILNQDPNECQKAPSRGVDICLQDVARILKDPTICESLSNSNHRCYWNLAVSMQRDDLCKFAPFEQACRSISKRDSSMCETISEEIERSKCYYNTAILTENMNICQNLDDETSSSTCIAHVEWCSRNNFDCTFLAQRYT